MKVKLLRYTMDAELLCGAAALTSTKSGSPSEIFEKMDSEKAKRIISKVTGYGHMSVIEHASFTFSIEGVSRVCCYDEETEVLTINGWKHFRDVSNQDLFCTLNPHNHKIEYQQASDFFSEWYRGRMYAIRSTKVDLQVTLNHRMYVYPFDTQRAKRAKKARKNNPSMWEIRHAEDIIGKRVAYKKTGLWDHPDITVVEIQVTRIPCGKGMRKVGPLVLNADMFAEFLGYYLSEGSLSHSKGTGYDIILSQKPGDVLDRMYKVVKALGFRPRYLTNGKSLCGVTFSSYQLYQYLAPLGKAQDKHIPREILLRFSRRQCEILLQALITGNSSRYFKRGPWRYYTISRRLADDVQELALKAGYAADISVINRTGHSHTGPRGAKIRCSHASYVVTILTRQNVPLVNHGKKQDRLVDYNGMTYCVKVPNGLLYVRRNGKAVWCGNSHQLVRHRIASYTQQSQRYVAYDALEKFVMPPNIAKNAEAKKVFDDALEKISEAYRKLLDMGIPKEDARFILPNAAKTNIIVTMNARELRHFFNLRCCNRAQWEIREVAIEMLRQARKAAPALFENAGPTCVELGYCPEGKMKPPECNIEEVKKRFRSL